MKFTLFVQILALSSFKIWNILFSEIELIRSFPHNTFLLKNASSSKLKCSTEEFQQKPRSFPIEPHLCLWHPKLLTPSLAAHLASWQVARSLGATAEAPEASSVPVSRAACQILDLESQDFQLPSPWQGRRPESLHYQIPWQGVRASGNSGKPSKWTLCLHFPNTFCSSHSMIIFKV